MKTLHHLKDSEKKKTMFLCLAGYSCSYTVAQYIDHCIITRLIFGLTPRRACDPFKVHPELAQTVCMLFTVSGMPAAQDLILLVYSIL